MILIGQYDSPYVRRVGVAMTLYGLPFDHRPWSTFSDADRIREFNPLIRVPVLVLDDGGCLIESSAIIDYIDSLVTANRRMYPVDEPARHEALRIASLATGVSDKAVSLFYELNLHEKTSALWVDRCRGQIEAALGVLEADRASRLSEYWFGGAIGHADIVVAAMLRHLTEAHPDLVSMADHPALDAHAARLEALPAFRSISQPFIPPAAKENS